MGQTINYLYYGFFFALLMLLETSSIFTKESLGGSQVFFLLYALGQVLVELSVFILTAFVLHKYVGRWAAAVFIGLTFCAVFLHIFDFLMDRILDLSVWEALNVFVFQESIGNFFYLLDASGISLWIWCVAFALIAALPFLGILIYHVTDQISARKELPITHAHFLQIALCVPLALLLWDLSASKVIDPDAYTAFRKSLPWKTTFLHPATAQLTLPGSVLEPPEEPVVLRAIEENKSVLEKRPNIFIFIAESLRADSITENIAPHLSAFRDHCTHFSPAVAGGNASQISWFSIFHSQYSYHWKTLQSKWKMGSPALKLLKQLGYQLRLYSSAQLSYYGMEELLFGEKAHLLDSRQYFLHSPPQSAADTDAAALGKLQKDLEHHPEWKEGQVFIIFWDCTHFDYSWPKAWRPKFTPFAQHFAYFRTIQSQKNIRQIKNRYHNAVNYLDSLFGQFMQHMDKDAIVVFSADHGEEFFEHGHLFHNSHLTKEQTCIPLYVKFGDGSKPLQPRKVISQMDIFPSIIDYLGVTPPQFLQGNSLFQEPHFPYAITSRYNAGLTPYEFSIHNGTHKLIAQFANRHQILDSKQLQIISLRTHDDKNVKVTDAHHWIQQEFGAAIEQLTTH
ncbi:MAG: sulfatase-like hydrolase/transferase [Verrucomicrobia bacterium]|nr:sulfatase-like hydrolase/transferase [Verrucomicrobiota bacterium]MBU6446350.1 sulfatase-like hydrolase/transferase [Verrucomicrobiota bacterium]MDE3047476.1 sulfatase-like hydrolase/transferase [Verrucomicrobiota bacterium]